MAKIRTRFAPSPTGYLHIGGARTALFNYLFAKHYGGKFILRIEDTDRERSTPEAIQAILDAMTWLRLEWDEGPFYQTERYSLYKEKIRQLLAEGKAYPCVCTPEELDAKRQLAQKEKRKPAYDGTCRPADGVISDLPTGKPYTIRFRSPREGTTVVEDAVKGNPPSEELFKRAAALAAAACEPVTDQRGSAEYKRHVAGVLVERVLERACARALQEEEE